MCSASYQASVPLFERLRFSAIASSNLDEFFAKRVGGLMRQRDAGIKNLKEPLHQRWSPTKQLMLISQEVKRFYSHQAKIFKESLLPELFNSGIRIVAYKDLNSLGQDALDNLFQSEIELQLTPIKIDPGHPFPYLPSSSVNLAVLLEDPTKASIGPQCAIVNTPPSLKRWRIVPPQYAKDISWQEVIHTIHYHSTCTVLVYSYHSALSLIKVFMHFGRS